MNSTERRVRALDDGALAWAQRGLWTICIGIYLTVFIGGIQVGGAELNTMGRAAAYTVAAAVLGRVALGLLAGASLPIRSGRMAEQEGPLGSLVDLTSSLNVAQHTDEQAQAA